MSNQAVLDTPVPHATVLDATAPDPTVLDATLLDATVATGCCPPLAVRALTPESAARLAPMFKALGDPVRLRLLSLIASAGEACVCDLTQAFDVSAPTISHHLRVLREAGLVDGERRATWVHYRVHPDALNRLGALLHMPATQRSAAGTSSGSAEGDGPQ